MNIVRISKLLDIISYLGIIGIIGFYIFQRPSTEILVILLLIISLIRMVGANLKANHYEKKYKKIKDDNEFLIRRNKELENKEN